MRILFINTTYGIGSTGKLTKSFVEYLHSEGHQAYCVYADGENVDKCPEGIKLKSRTSRIVTIFLERLTGRLGVFSPLSTIRAQKYINKIHPDIIYLGNLHGYYINFIQLMKYIKQHNIPCVQVMWDEFSFTGTCAFSLGCRKFETGCSNCPNLKEYPSSWLFDGSSLLFRKKMTSYDYSNIAFVSVPYTISEAKRSALLCDKWLFQLDEAIDQTNFFFPRNSQSLRDQLGISDGKKVVLTVAVYPSERKGGRYFLELARHFESNQDFVFVHVGFLADKSECPKNYIPIGFVNDQVLLSLYYSLADIFVCTSLAETQPNTCLEALSCGTRICGFNISGIPTCADSPFGEYVTPGNVQDLVSIIEKVQTKTKESITETRKYAESRFSSVDYNRRLLEIGKIVLSNAKGHEVTAKQ